MPRKRTVTAKRVTEEITVTDEETTDVIPWAPGRPGVYPDEPRWRAQRSLQVQRTWDLLGAAADDGCARLDAGTLAQAVTMLRALPGASCMELEHGRSL